ncbi:MAG: hypothetical protein H6719_24515 [Sandaracinaceae bacterium]|nr:hypothetical protein [Sandaracinaceae bacterium]
MGLKDLLARVISGLTGASDAPRVKPPDEPIPTRAMAELYIDQGHLDRAAAILAGLDTPAAAERLSEVRAMQARERLRAAVETHAEPGVTLARDGAYCAIAWVVDEPGCARAAALLGGGELTLRVVSVRAVDGAVERTTSDRPAGSPRGVEVVEIAPEARLVVSVGLARDGGFVSIAHG